MQNQQQELTFTQIFYLLKASLKRAILIMLIAVILLTSLLITVRTLTGYNTSRAVITIADDSAISLDSLNRTKAVSVQKAIKNSNEQSLDGNFENKVLNNLTVTAIIPSSIDKDDEEVVYTPSSFTISLSGRGLSLSAEELNSTLDKIIVELIRAQGLSKLPELEPSSALEAELEVLEYFQIAENLSLQAENTYYVISEQIKNRNKLNEYVNPDNGYSFNDVLNRLTVMQTKIDNLKNYIIVNRVENVDGLEEIFSIEKKNAEKEKQTYEEMLVKAKEILDSYPSATATTQGNGSVIVDGSAYQAIAKEYYEILEAQRITNTAYLKYEEYLNLITAQPKTTDTVKIEYTKNELKSVFNSLKSAIDDYRILAENYNDSYLPTSEIQIVAPAHADKQAYIDLTAILLVNFIAVALIWIFAFVKTYGLTKQANCKNLSIINMPAEYQGESKE